MLDEVKDAGAAFLEYLRRRAADPGTPSTAAPDGSSWTLGEVRALLDGGEMFRDVQKYLVDKGMARAEFAVYIDLIELYSGLQGRVPNDWVLLCDRLAIEGSEHGMLSQILRKYFTRGAEIHPVRLTRGAHD